MSSTPRPAAGRRLKQIGVLLMVLGAICGGIAALPVAHALSISLIDELNSPVYTAPFDASVDLKRGKYLLLESRDGSAQVMSTEVRVLDPTGTELTDVRSSGGNDSVTRGGERFVDVLEFTTSQAGRYRIYVAFPPNARLIVGRDPADAFREVARWFALGGGGLLVVLLGFILLLISFGKSHPSRRPSVFVHYGEPPPVLVHYGQPPPSYGQPPVPPHHGQPPGPPRHGQPPATPPAGWYPDPGSPDRWRYWDGYRWQP